jgi:MULE transposase domain
MVATIAFFLNWIKAVSPAVWPSIIMMDCDLAQIKALEAVYPDSQIFLCIWHVLHAMRSHFVPEKFQSLWAKVKSLVKTEDSHEFERIWTEVLTNPSVPQSFMEYLNTK